MPDTSMPSTPYQFLYEYVTIVVIGEFNPRIVTPFWLARYDLISIEEAEESTKEQLEVTHRKISAFETGWFKIRLTTDRLAIECRDPAKYRQLRDLVIGLFSLLEHTPVTALGFNRHFQVKVSDTESWHKIGHHYAPKSTWSKFLYSPGLLSVSILGKRAEPESGSITAKLESGLSTQLVVSFNEHFNLIEDVVEDEDEDEDRIHHEALQKLEEKCNTVWDDFLGYTRKSAEYMIEDPLGFRK